MQGSVLGRLLFLIYINALPDNVKFTCKIFADDTLFFPQSSIKTVPGMNWALIFKVCMIGHTSEWMPSKPDPNKQGQDVYFPRKTNKRDFQNLSFNGSNVEAWSSQKHLGLIMDDKLSFEVHVQNKIS